MQMTGLRNSIGKTGSCLPVQMCTSLGTSHNIGPNRLCMKLSSSGMKHFSCSVIYRHPPSKFYDSDRSRLVSSKLCRGMSKGILEPTFRVTSQMQFLSYDHQIHSNTISRGPDQWIHSHEIQKHNNHTCQYHKESYGNLRLNGGHDHHYRQQRSPIFPNIFWKFLASLGVAYLFYNSKTKQEIHLLPTASCLSSDSSMPGGTSSNQEQVCQNKDVKSAALEPSPQKKIGADKNEHGRISLATAIEKAQELCRRRKDEVGSPGLVVCVSVNGKQIYAEGFGYADLENRIPITPSSVLRIASISKAITATIIAKMWEKGQIDIEKPVQHYVPSFPQKEYLREKVEITVRQLLNHTGGIRHYISKDDPAFSLDRPITDMLAEIKTASSKPFYAVGPSRKTERGTSEKKDRKATESEKENTEFDREEYYLMQNFPTTEEALQIFANDRLVAKPGTRFVYTTFGYTLLAAVIESITNKPYTDVLMRTLQHLGLKETYLDLHSPIIYNRARNYVKDENGRIINAPYVDLSYKWAGGGLLSTPEDVVKFGNILLYSVQHQDDDLGLPGFLKSSTVWKFWAPQAKKGASHMYGLGFELTPSKEHYGMCEHHSFGAGHTGGAVGMSSAMFILPHRATTGGGHPDKGSNSQTHSSSTSNIMAKPYSKSSSPLETAESKGNNPRVTAVQTESGRAQVSVELPQGVVVAVFINMVAVSVRDTAERIARIFEDVDFSL